MLGLLDGCPLGLPEGGYESEELGDSDGLKLGTRPTVGFSVGPLLG